MKDKDINYSNSNNNIYDISINKDAIEMNNKLKGVEIFNYNITKNLSKSISDINRIPKEISRGFQGISKFDISITKALSESMNIASKGISNAFKKQTKFDINMARTISNNISSEVINSILTESIARLNENTQLISEVLKEIVNIGLQYKINDYGISELKDKCCNETEEGIEANKILNDDKLTTEQKIYSIIEKFKIKHPIIAILLTFFIISSIQSYVNDIGQKVIQNCIASARVDKDYLNNKNKVNKTIKNSVIKDIDINTKENKKYILNTYRFVNTERLCMRVDSTIMSNNVYELSYGNLVKILYKNKNWSFIEYDNDGEIIKGWVFTRYISRFDK